MISFVGFMRQSGKTSGLGSILCSSSLTMNGAVGTIGTRFIEFLWLNSISPKGKVPPPPAIYGNSWPPGPNPAFNFTKLGVRVPAVLVSAWLDHDVSSTVYEHSSIPASLKILFNLKGPGPDGFLTVRDQTANSPLNHVKFRSTPRKDLYWLREGFSEELQENIQKESI